MKDIGLELRYDLDTAKNTHLDDLGKIDLSALSAFAPGVVSEGSENLYFDILAVGFASFVIPGVNTFDPNAGEYSFLLRAKNFGKDVDASVAVVANVAPIPLPAGFPLLLAAIGGLAFLRKRKSS